ncbi:MAG TPA: hypothetical protein VMU88_00855 [bacterium]|nr:hypothetical protein [bacterium]
MRRENFMAVCAALWALGMGLGGLAQGCKKTDSPFNVYAPHGLDVPSPTPLPLTGAIVVNVSDGANVVPNLSVWAIEPGNAVTLTAETNGGGQAAFNPNPLAPGVWTLRIPPQSNALSDYGLSQQLVTIGPDVTNATVNFSPGVFFGAVSAVAGSSYPTTLQNNLVFNISVSQTGTLDVPVTYAWVGMPFSVVPGPVTLDMNNPQQSVTVQVPACSVVEPSSSVAFYRSGGSLSLTVGFSNSVTIQRGYPITITSVTRAESPLCQAVTVSKNAEVQGVGLNDTWQINVAGACPGTPFKVHIGFTSTNNSSTSNPTSETFFLYSGTPYTFNWKPTTTSPVNYAVTITDPNNPLNVYTGGFIFDPHYGSGGSCRCGNGGYTGCQSTTAIPAFNNLVVNP